MITASLCFLPGAVAAQDSGLSGIVLPGALNATVGTIGSLEPGNLVGSVTFEQGVTLWREGSLFVVGFTDLTVKADSLGYVWNNALPHLVGGKLVLAGPRGVAQAVVGVAGDLRRDTPNGLTLAGYFSYWGGWRLATSHGEFPGSVWATSGRTTASEPENWITAAHIDQGVTVKRIGRFALVPFAAATVSTDTQDRNWNNRAFFDAGVKVRTALRGAAVDLGVAQRVTHSWQIRERAAAPVGFVNLWLGWMPRVRRQ